MASFILKQAYLYIHQAKDNQTYKRNPSIHLACEKPYHTSKTRQQLDHGSKTLTYYKP